MSDTPRTWEEYAAMRDTERRELMEACEFAISERNKVKAELSASQVALEATTARVRELERENERLRKDAERLQFLCSRMFAVELSTDGQHKWIFRNMPLVGANAQAAIDAALAEQGGGE